MVVFSGRVLVDVESQHQFKQAVANELDISVYSEASSHGKRIAELLPLL